MKFEALAGEVGVELGVEEGRLSGRSGVLTPRVYLG